MGQCGIRRMLEAAGGWISSTPTVGGRESGFGAPNSRAAEVRTG